ncbi:MAG: formate dehydrogenase subunit gamma [Sideroxydans sp.]
MNSRRQREQITALIQAHQDRPGALLPLLHAIQDALGFIPPEAIGEIAGALHLSRAEVHGVITFYHHFRTTPPARHTLHICCAEACQSMGAQQLVEHAEKKLAHLAAGDCELQPVYCLGLCATSPALMLDGELHARVTPEKFDALVKKIGGAK